jgi:hypothetical protein
MVPRNAFLKKLVLFIIIGLFSCVTINIYFPAEKVEKVAEKIVGDIRAKDDQEAPPQPPEPEQKESFLRRFIRYCFLPSNAYAQRETTVSNAAIRALKARIKGRRPSLVPHLRKGVIRENGQGYVDLVNPGKVDVKTRAKVQRLVQAENRDRKQLYLEVARALKIDPSQVDRIGRIFAKYWQR